MATTSYNHATEQPRLPDTRGDDVTRDDETSDDFYQIIHQQRVLLNQKDARIATLQDEVARLQLYIESTNSEKATKKAKKSRRKSSSRHRRTSRATEDGLGSAPPARNLKRGALTSPGVDACRPTLLRAQSSREYSTTKPAAADEQVLNKDARHRSKSCRDFSNRRRRSNSSRRSSSRQRSSRRSSSRRRSHSRRGPANDLSSSSMSHLKVPFPHEDAKNSESAPNLNHSLQLLGETSQEANSSDRRSLTTSSKSAPNLNHSLQLGETCSQEATCDKRSLTTSSNLEEFLRNPRLVELYASSVNSNASPTGVTDGVLNDGSSERLLTNDSSSSRPVSKHKQRSKSNKKKKKKAYRSAPQRKVSEEQLLHVGDGAGAALLMLERPPGQHPEKEDATEEVLENSNNNSPETAEAAATTSAEGLSRSDEQLNGSRELDQHPEETCDPEESNGSLLAEEEDDEPTGGFSSGVMIVRSPSRTLSRHLHALQPPLRQPDDDSDEETQTSQPLMHNKPPASPCSATPSLLDLEELTPNSSIKSPSLLSSVPPPDRGQTASPGPSLAPPPITYHASIGSSVRKDESFETYQVVDHEVIDPYNDVGIYTGSLSSRTPHMPQGFGRMVYNDEKRSYEGEWVDGRWHGKGSLMNGNGDVYEGMFANDARHGEGSYFWASGRSYVGTFLNDKRHGHGTLTFADCSKYVGEFFHGAREGKGRCTFADGGHYDGEWRNNMFNGLGECVWPDGRLYKGDFHENAAHGYGIEYNPDGTIRHDGLWDHDTPV